MSKLSDYINTDDYPDWVDALADELNINIDMLHLIHTAADNNDTNLSNIFVSLVFNQVEAYCFTQDGDDCIASCYINNMDTHFYINGDPIQSQSDILDAITAFHENEEEE